MPNIRTVLKSYKEDGISGVWTALRGKGHRALTRLSRYLPAQPESRRSRDAAQYWSESEASRRIRDHSHWVGEGRWEDPDAWASIGESHLQMWKGFSAICSSEQVSKRMVEWGPGGGANAVVFAQFFEEFYGVDISQANLDECRGQLERRGYKGFNPVLINAEHPEESLTHIVEPCDFFLSTAVFQHFPSKDYGARVLSVARDMLRPRAIALIQIRYDDLSRRFRPNRRDYKSRAMTFTSYTLHEFWNLASDKGLTPRFVELRPEVNYGYFYLIRV